MPSPPAVQLHGIPQSFHRVPPQRHLPGRQRITRRRMGCEMTTGPRVIRSLRNFLKAGSASLAGTSSPEIVHDSIIADQSHYAAGRQVRRRLDQTFGNEACQIGGALLRPPLRGAAPQVKSPKSRGGCWWADRVDPPRSARRWGSPPWPGCRARSGSAQWADQTGRCPRARCWRLVLQSSSPPPPAS